jgi:succinate dehydrogenase / fumarate reductase membrane anchor subunit
LLWFAVSMTSLATAGYAAVTMWLRAPVNAILMLALIAALFHHMQLGLQVVVEDYVHGHARKFLLLLIIKYGAALLAISTAFAVLKVAFA